MFSKLWHYFSFYSIKRWQYIRIHSFIQTYKSICKGWLRSLHCACATVLAKWTAMMLLGSYWSKILENTQLFRQCSFTCWPTDWPTDWLSSKYLWHRKREIWRNRLVLFRIFGQIYLTAKATKTVDLVKMFSFFFISFTRCPLLSSCLFFMVKCRKWHTYIHRWSTIISVLTASFALKANNSRWEMKMDMIMIIIQFSEDGMDESRPTCVQVYIWLHSHRLN